MDDEGPQGPYLKGPEGPDPLAVLMRVAFGGTSTSPCKIKNKV